MPTPTDLSAELARQMRLLNGTVVQPHDFDFAALPGHLRVTFRVVENGVELSRGKDLGALRKELSSHVRADLTKAAREEERSGLLAWTVGEIDRTISAGQVTGYPALVDEGTVGRAAGAGHRGGAVRRDGARAGQADVARAGRTGPPDRSIARPALQAAAVDRTAC